MINFKKDVLHDWVGGNMICVCLGHQKVIRRPCLWTMGNSPVTVKENNEHLGLNISSISEEANNVDAKLQKARRALFSLIEPVIASKCLLSLVI